MHLLRAIVCKRRGWQLYNGFDRFGREVIKQWRQYTLNHFRDRFDYKFDYAGNRLSRDVPSFLNTNDDTDQAFAYDGLQRLKAFDEGTQSGSSISGTPAREEDWTLDQLGNWPGFVQKAAGSTTLDQTRYHNAVNEIDGNGGASITASTGTNWADPAYDTAGNMTSMPNSQSLSANLTLKYDAWNRLVEVKNGGTTVQTNEFDGLGRRIVRVDSGASDTYDYYYNEDWQLLEERKDGVAYPLSQYVWHPYYIDALAIRYYDSNTDNMGIVDYYYCHDANFNVTAVLDNTGVVVERYDYTPYGQVTVLNPDFSLDSSGMGDGLTDIGNTHFYTGRELDLETGLQLNRMRFYASWLGRWVTRDPIGYNAGDLNLYNYVKGSPAAHSDPSGEITMIDSVSRTMLKCGKSLVKPPNIPKFCSCACLGDLKCEKACNNCLGTGASGGAGYCLCIAFGGTPAECRNIGPPPTAPTPGPAPPVVPPVQPPRRKCPIYVKCTPIFGSPLCWCDVFYNGEDYSGIQACSIGGIFENIFKN